MGTHGSWDSFFHFCRMFLSGILCYQVRKTAVIKSNGVLKCWSRVISSSGWCDLTATSGWSNFIKALVVSWLDSSAIHYARSTALNDCPGDPAGLRPCMMQGMRHVIIFLTSFWNHLLSSNAAIKRSELLPSQSQTLSPCEEWTSFTRILCSRARLHVRNCSVSLHVMSVNRTSQRTMHVFVTLIADLFACAEIVLRWLATRYVYQICL